MTGCIFSRNFCQCCWCCHCSDVKDIHDVLEFTVYDEVPSNNNIFTYANSSIKARPFWNWKHFSTVIKRSIFLVRLSLSCWNDGFFRTRITNTNFWVERKFRFCESATTNDVGSNWRTRSWEVRPRVTIRKSSSNASSSTTRLITLVNLLPLEKLYGAIHGFGEAYLG